MTYTDIVEALASVGDSGRVDLLASPFGLGGHLAHVPRTLGLDSLALQVGDSALQSGPSDATLRGTMTLFEPNDLEVTLTLQPAADKGVTWSFDAQLASLPLASVLSRFFSEDRLPLTLPAVQLTGLAIRVQPGGVFRVSGSVGSDEGEFSLAGVDISVPKLGLNLTLERAAGLAPLITVAVDLGASQELSIGSTFPWLRDVGGLGDVRELLPDAASAPSAGSSSTAVDLTLVANRDVHVTLLRAGGGQSVAFFEDFDASDWTAGLHVGAFQFPFLASSDSSAGAGSGSSGAPDQRVLSKVSDHVDLSIDDQGRVVVELSGTLHMAGCEFDIRLPLAFDLTRFAFLRPTGGSIDLFSREAEYVQPALFGLTWTFRGAASTDDSGAARYHYFTLATEDFDYQIRQAPGSSFELAYTRASKEPIGFAVSDFALTPAGISLTADVIDRPVELNGVATKFTFRGSQLRIVENRVADLTLSGSGPLPPALVGDSTADISLQFRNLGGDEGLTLVAGAAALRGTKLLDAKSTRFRFSVDALGMRFVRDNGYHFYFTLTGAARFVLGKGDDKRNGVLSYLPNVQIDFIDAPLTGDMRVLAKHIRLLVELPRPVVFPLAGTYEFELRSLGFLPQFDVFDGDAAMQIGGQIRFASGKGDQRDPRPDFHSLYVGLPAKGEHFPRLHMNRLPLAIQLGEALKLDGDVEFVDDDQAKGFKGAGVLEVKGIPPIAASFAFLRVRRTPTEPWKRAWFIYIEARHISLRVPYLEFYLREIGLGFGYRYTVLALKTADGAASIGDMIRQLEVLSRSQGDLSKPESWAVDVEAPGESLRWTVALRGMIAQTSAATTPFAWNEASERKLACSYLFDVVAAFRSDLTFFLNLRGWINTSYGAFEHARGEGEQLEPFLSGFALLSPRRRMFLAHLANNPDGHLGSNPELPAFVQSALRSSRFSVTALIQPGLVHFELGWPNQLSWTRKISPLTERVRAGFIFRASRTEVFVGASFVAEASLEFSASVDLGLVGASISARAYAGYGGRLLGLMAYDEPTSPVVYGAIGLELRVELALELWIRIPLLFTTLTLRFRFDFQVLFTASLELGLEGNTPGLRGQGTVSVRIMGHQLGFGVRVGLNEERVQRALDRTEPFLHVGLTADEDPGGVPGVQASASANKAAPQARVGAGKTAVRTQPSRPVATEARKRAVNRAQADAAKRDRLVAGEKAQDIGVTGAFDAPEHQDRVFAAADYTAAVVRDLPGPDGQTYTYVGLLPAAAESGEAPGFLPVPPDDRTQVVSDFRIDFPDVATGPGLARAAFDEATGELVWHDVADGVAEWAADWHADVVSGSEAPARAATPAQASAPPAAAETPEAATSRLDGFLRNAYITANSDALPGKVAPIADPTPLAPLVDRIADPRVSHPTDDAYEAAVRGAAEQALASPHFRHDIHSEFGMALTAAFDEGTTVYDPSGAIPAEADARARHDAEQQAHEVRSIVLHQLATDLTEWAKRDAAGRRALARTSPLFRLGLVFRVQRDENGQLPDWVDRRDAQPESLPTIRQRQQRRSVGVDAAANAHVVRAFNTQDVDFALHPPRFDDIRTFSDAKTIAVAWRLTLPQGTGDTEGLEADDYLRCYRVRRRALDDSEPEVTYEAKPSAVLAPRIAQDGKPSALHLIAPRFQLVDHFHGTSPGAAAAALPARGRSYLYTITPIDVGGQAGQPVTLVITRYPDQPAPVPADAEMRVDYTLAPSDLALHDSIGVDAHPPLVRPRGIELTWTLPAASQGGADVAVKDYVLVFRREDTLPIGHYGLDAAVRRPPEGAMPSSQARPRTSDVRVVLELAGRRRGHRMTETLPVARLIEVGVFPAEDVPRWQPDAWRVFVQTISANGVPSALAPVAVHLRFRSDERLFDAGSGIEERRPAELEWLPMPTVFRPLPAEDVRAETGDVHVPTLSVADPIDLTASAEELLGALTYGRSPAGERAVRVQWNQAPSGRPDVALGLNAGFDVLQLDVDAHTREAMESAEGLAAAVRTVGEVELLPADEAALDPGDTLRPARWQACYASHLTRFAGAKSARTGVSVVDAAWHSWRDSELIWPEFEPAAEADANTPVLPAGADAGLHGFLQAVAAHLAAPEGDSTPHRQVEIQPPPPASAVDLAGWLEATSAASDPYGWGVLQRLGLSATYIVRDAGTGEPLSGQALVEATRAALASASASYAGRELGAPHLELLVQPGRRLQLAAGALPQEALLAMVQVSLRPAVRPWLGYRRIAIVGTPGLQVEVAITAPVDASLTVLQRLGTDAAVRTDVMEKGASAKRELRLGMDGRAELFVRTAAASATESASGLAVTAKPVVDAKPPEVVDVQISDPVDGTDPISQLFAAPVDDLAQRQSSWTALLQWVDPLVTGSVSSKSASAAVAGKDNPDESETRQALSTLMQWSARFFEHSAPARLGSPGPSPTLYLAVAGARAGSPAHVVPDGAGRVAYTTELADNWAHALRYYVRPNGRYGRLWQSLATSPALFGPEAIAAHASMLSRMDDAPPTPGLAGADVVLERVAPIDAPVVLSSARLDVTEDAGGSARPGAIWEVLLAEHREQLLSDRNTTTARRLGYRQLVFSLWRSPLYDAPNSPLRSLLDAKRLVIAPVGEHRDAPLPIVPLQSAGLPVKGNALDPAALDPAALDPDALSADAARGLDLPLRNPDAHRPTLALQWDGLPFYYVHQLRVAAQAARVISEVTSVEQRDLTYIAPRVSAFVTKVDPDGAATIEIPTARIWDAVPSAVQARWPAELPVVAGGARSWSAVADPEVVYQLVELFEGDLEAQAELSYVPADEWTWALRQLGQGLDVELLDGGKPDEGEQGRFGLRVRVRSTVRTAPIAVVPSQVVQPTRSRLSAKDGGQIYVGAGGHADWAHLLMTRLPVLSDRPSLPDNPSAEQSLAAERYLRRRFPCALTQASPALPVGVGARYEWVLTAPTGTGATELQALGADDSVMDSELAAAIVALASASEMTVPHPVAPWKPPAGGGATLPLQPHPTDDRLVRWWGPFTDDDRELAETALPAHLAANLAAAFAALEDGDTPDFVDVARLDMERLVAELAEADPAATAPAIDASGVLLTLDPSRASSALQAVAAVFDAEGADRSALQQLSADLSADLGFAAEVARLIPLSEAFLAQAPASPVLSDETQDRVRVYEGAAFEIGWEGDMDAASRRWMHEWADSADEGLAAAIRSVMAWTEPDQPPIRGRTVGPLAEPPPTGAPDGLVYAPLRIVVEGRLPASDADALADALSDPRDRAAIGRLYAASQTRTGRAGRVYVSARRGSARPSALTPLATKQPDRSPRADDTGRKP